MRKMTVPGPNMNVRQPPEPRQITALEREIAELSMVENGLRKVIGGLRQFGEDYIRGMAANTPFMVIDETQIKSKDEMIIEMVQNLTATRLKKQRLVTFAQEGTPGLTALAEQIIDDLEERGVTGAVQAIKDKAEATIRARVSV